MKKSKWSGNETLKKVGLNELPKYVSDNIDKYSKWID